MWSAMEKGFGRHFFFGVIEEKYGYLFNKENRSKIAEQINKVKNEAEFQMTEVSEHSKRELESLRRDKRILQEELNIQRERRHFEIEQAKEEASKATEAQYKVREAQSKELKPLTVLVFRDNDDAKTELYKRIKELETMSEDTRNILIGYDLKIALLKWSFLGKIKKIESASGERKQKLITQEMSSLIMEKNLDTEEMIKELEMLRKDNSDLTMQSLELSYENHNLKDKIVTLEVKLEDVQQEALWQKE